MMADEESFPLRIWSGLFKKKHWKKMGNAIWLFGMLIDKVTREENGEGHVLGGKSVSYHDFKNELPVTQKQYHRYMQILRDGGYIHTRKSAGGLTIVIHKSKKFVHTDRDKNVPIPSNEGTYLSEGRDKNVPIGEEKGTKMSPSRKRDITVRDIKETEEPLPDYLKIWNIIHGVFKLPEDAHEGYKGDIIETIQRLGMEITENACKIFIKAEEEHPPHGKVKSITSFFHWKRIDEYVAMIPEKKQHRYFACLECRSAIMIEDNEHTDQVINSTQGLCAGPREKPDLAHEPIRRIEITQVVRDCQSKKLDNQQIRTIVNKYIEQLRL